MCIFLAILFGFLLLVSLCYFIVKVLSRKIKIPCPSWLRWIVEIESPVFKSHNSKFIIENLQLEKGMKVLDIGCGPGRLTIPLSEKVGETGQIFAIDIQEKMLDVVRKRAQQKNLTNITFLNIPMGNGKLQNYLADRAVLVTVLGEIPHREKALTEIFNSLKSGGILAITEIIFDPHFQSKQKVMRFAAAIGFTEKSFYGNKSAYTIYFSKP